MDLSNIKKISQYIKDKKKAIIKKNLKCSLLSGIFLAIEMFLIDSYHQHQMPGELFFIYISSFITIGCVFAISSLNIIEHTFTLPLETFKIKLNKKNNPFLESIFYANESSIINLILATHIIYYELKKEPLFELKEIEKFHNAIIYNKTILEKQNFDTLPEIVQTKVKENIDIINSHMSLSFYHIKKLNLINNEQFNININLSNEENLSQCSIIDKQIKTKIEEEKLKEKIKFQSVIELEKDYYKKELNLISNKLEQNIMKHDKKLSL